MEMSENPEELKKQLEVLQEEAKKIRKKLPKKHKSQPLPQSLNDEEFKKVIEGLPERKGFKETKIAFLLAYESGLRISEVKNLEQENIDLNAKTVFVRRGKFSKDRVVPLPKTWKKYMINLIPIKKTVRSLERNFKNSVIKMGLNTRYHFHCLRHSFATHCLERGMPINQVQVLLGHSSVGTTNVYIRANPKDALNKYQEIF